MKKKIYSFMMLFLTQCAMSFADNTDISTIDNVIYVEPFTLEAGTESSISFKMKNTAAIRSFGFDLYLPEGITAVPKSSGSPWGSLNYDRVPKNEDGYPVHQMTLSFQEGNVIRFLCDAQEGQTFIGNSGDEIAILKVKVSETMEEGDYPIVMKTMKLSETDIANYYETNYIESTVTITGPGDGRILLDETSTTAPAAAANVNVRVKRTINANEWSTIVLPFAMTEAQIGSAFGEDVQVQLADFTGYDVTEEGESVVGITVNFNAVTAIEANHPYIIKVSKTVTEFTVDGVDVAPEDAPCVAFGSDYGRPKKYHPMDFVGTYVADFNFYQDAQSGAAIFLSGGSFYYATETTRHMKAFRAYFDFDDILAEVDNANSNVKMAIGGEETRIEGLIPETTDESIYDLSGRKVAKAEKGVYIINGKKVLK